MNTRELRSEISKRRRRAKKLAVDALFIRIYYEHGFRNFKVSTSSAPSPVFPSVTQMTVIERDTMQFRIDDRQYTLRARTGSYDNGSAEMELFNGERVVFGQILGRRRFSGRVFTRAITAFAEGEWLRDFQRIDEEARRYWSEWSDPTSDSAIEEEARRFGINPQRDGRRRSFLARLGSSIFNGSPLA